MNTKLAKKSCPIPILILVISASGCRALGPNAEAGTALGGLGGAAIGAMAGAPEGNALEGAAIGAVAGGLTGRALGNLADREDERALAQINYERQQVALNSVSREQVIQMAQSGLSDEVIIGQIQSKGIPNPLTTGDLIFLKNQGVSDAVIRAMQVATPGGQRAPVRVVPQPVFVEPYPCYGVPHHRYRRHRHRPGFSWSYHFD